MSLSTVALAQTIREAKYASGWLADYADLADDLGTEPDEKRAIVVSALDSLLAEITRLREERDQADRLIGMAVNEGQRAVDELDVAVREAAILRGLLGEYRDYRSAGASPTLFARTEAALAATAPADEPGET